MEELPCPRCGFVNPASARFCTSCGRPLVAVPETQAPTLWEVRPPFTGLAQPYLDQYNAAHGRQVERTKTGILLLLIGALLGWIPVISLVAGIISLIGAILVILGRKAFGRVHARNVLISVALFVGGIVGIIILALIEVFALLPAFTGGTPDPVAVRSAFMTFFYGVAIVVAVSSLSSVLFTYELQRPMGRAILWAAWATETVIQLAIVVFLAPAFGDALVQAFAGGTFNMAPLDAVSATAELWGLLAVVPSMLFAAADYLAWQRIHRREIPARPALPPPPPPAPTG